MSAFGTLAPIQENQNVPWNKGKLIGQKLPLKLKEIWGIRIRLQMEKNSRELALFNLAIDSKLRGCDLVKLKVFDVAQGNRVSSHAIVMQQKTHRPVQFEITEQSRDSLASWICQAKLKPEDHLFPSRIHDSPHISTRQYARIVENWVQSKGARCNKNHDAAVGSNMIDFIGLKILGELSLRVDIS